MGEKLYYYGHVWKTDCFGGEKSISGGPFTTAKERDARKQKALVSFGYIKPKWWQWWRWGEAKV